MTTVNTENNEYIIDLTGSDEDSSNDNSNIDDEGPKDNELPIIDLCDSPVPLKRSRLSPTAELADEPAECPICLLPFEYPTRLTCGHIFCFLCLKGIAIYHQKCAMCRLPIPTDFLINAKLLSFNSNTEQNNDGQPYWWFYEGFNGWWQYDNRTSNEIEDAFNHNLANITILIAGHLYVVDLKQMTQHPIHQPSRVRYIKRDRTTSHSKGIAGLKI